MRFRYIVLLLIVVLAGGEITREAIRTLDELRMVERGRDAWQRPDDVIASLNLSPGNTVEDVGSGAGYFALKLARMVGGRGAVFAVDTRAQSLGFLWIRARQEGLAAVRVMHRDAADAAAPNGVMLDGVLIANTYHELTMPDRVLDLLFRSLRPGSRMVILDRGPQSSADPSWRSGALEHEVPSDLVQQAVRSHGFEIVSTDNRFIEGKPERDDHWWLIVARKSPSI